VSGRNEMAEEHGVDEKIVAVEVHALPASKLINPIVFVDRDSH
jgi:hypothetical protein